MRNLQKILALVLALVMSLSLMATAGARDFTDGDQIDETFAESVDVLTGLEVFQGYPSGDFQPKGDITRAEVAAIIYRIATGDVTDSQVGIYADYNKFSDVPSDNWAAGYINYCANAEYIKGRGDGKFYPQDKVTGYEALAMILRVVGYDKNGEFTGADWQVQTAATANQRKVTKNVNAGTLGNPASRETVAELLCQAILIEKVNYTLAFGYQISTDPQETIAYETFKMEKLEGVVTGNEIADLKTDKGTALGANQTRLVIDGREEVMNIPTGLDDIGECVRVYIRPENGTVRNDLVTSKVYSEGLNKVFTTSERVSSVGNTTGSSEGITSIEGAEHFINFDQAHKWEARSVIRYVVDLRLSEYDAMLMLYQNGGYMFALGADGKPTGGRINPPSSMEGKDWDKLIRTAYGSTYQYVKTIDAFTNLSDTDYANIRAIFTNADYTNTGVVKGEVYVGTSSIEREDDVSDDIRWEDFVNTYLKSEENKDQIDSNGQGFLLKIIDNDMDGIAEYVLQTRYTVAKVAANGTGLDIANLKLTDSDICNEVTASDKITVVSGTNLEASEDTVAAGDVVIYAMIDGVVRAQKAKFETSRVTTINRAANPVTATIESGEKKQSAVHEHSEGLASGLTNMVIGTNYTVYFDLFDNIAAFTEGDVGGFVLITDGWFNQTAAAREYAIQAYVDGALQTVNITNNGSLFINDGDVNNRWGALKTTFGTVTNVNEGDINYGGKHIHTIVATLEGNNLVPVDKSYRYSQTVRMLDIPSNTVPGINGADAVAYETTYGVDATAYQTPDKGPNNDATSKVYGRSDTVYYYVYKDGTKNTVTGQDNVVVRTYTGYNNIPGINSIYIEDVYAVGIRTNRNIGNTTPNYVYTADAVVVELNGKYQYQNTTSEQVFIPGATIVNNSVSRVAGQGWETVTMIRGNGEVQDVTVDLTVSKDYQTVNGYDPVDGRSRIAAGLYYMDPIDTNSSIYAIRRMDNADIRANNYLTGYVDSNTILANNWVQVEVMMQSQVKNPAGELKGVPAWSNLNVNGQPVGKRVDTENLYTLDGYTLTKAPAATVFEQWTGIHVNNNNAHPLNELYDVESNSFPLNLSNRNEILVRYSGDSVVWAVSFAELSGSDMNRAQTVWYNNLVANDSKVSSGVKFFGKDIVDNGLPTINDSVDYAVAKGNVIEFSNSIAATIQSWSLWRYSGTDYSIKLDDLNEQKNVDGARYKLEVTFVSGGSKTYYLELKAANNSFLVLTTVPGVTSSDFIDSSAQNTLVLRPNLTALDYIQKYKLTGGPAKVTWELATSSEKCTVEAEYDADGNIIVNTIKVIEGTAQGILTNAVLSVKATVVNQYGTTTQVARYDNPTAKPYRDIEVGRETVIVYNGVEYKYNMHNGNGGDGSLYTTVRLYDNTEVTLKSLSGDYGSFYWGTSRDNRLIKKTTTAGETYTFTFRVTALDNTGKHARIYFENETPVVNEITPETGIKSGQINTLTAPVSLKTTQKINAGTTINLNGNTLTIAPETTAGAGLEVADGKTLTIEGGKLDVSNVDTAAIKADGTGKIVLKNVELTSSSRGIFAKGTGDGAVIEITGGSITSVDVGVQTFGSKDNKAVVTLNNVNITSKDDAVYMPSKNDVITINGGTLTGGMCGVEMRGGKLVMDGVTVNTTAALNSRPTPPSGGSILYGAALAVTPYMTAADGDYTVDVSATNCKFNGTMPIRVVIESESYSGVGNVINLTSCTGRTSAYIGNQDIQMSNNVNQGNFSIKSGNVELAPVAPAPATPEATR